MKKVLTALAAVMLLASTAMAQNLARNAEGITLRNNAAKSIAKFGSAGNPSWNDTMSYCTNMPYTTSMGAGGSIYWGMKIEAAALAGRNNLIAVQLYIAYSGTYTLNIYSGANPGVAAYTETITATQAEVGSWRTITLATPYAIPQSQDLWVTFYNNDVSYPAAAVEDTNYVNGSLVSLDGTSWASIGNYGDFPYTWMIRAISDTYTATAPTVTINGPASIMAGDTAYFTAVSPTATSFNWNINADYSSSNGNTAMAVWNTTGDKTVSVTATNSAGSGSATHNINVYDCSPITTLPWTEEFENGARCWTFIDGNNSEIDNFRINTTYAVSGNALVSRYNASVAPNEWAITPAFTMPASANGVILSWYVKGGAYETANGKYKILVSTNGNSIADFTDSIYGQTITSTSPEANSNVQHSVSLANYGGQTIYIAFNNICDLDANTIAFDNIEVRAALAPVFTVSGPATTTTSEGAVFTATYAEGDQTNMTYNWTSTLGTVAGSTTTTATITYTTAGTDTVIFTATNNHGSFIDTSIVVVYNCDAISDFPFIEGFENGISECWTMVSADPANDDRFGVYADQAAYDGAADFRFSSYNTASDYNQFLITPELSLTAGNSYDLKFWYKAYRSSDKFRVKVSTTTSDTAAFTTLLTDVTDPATDWTELVCNLPAGTKYVAIDYYGNYAYYLYIDDLYIGAPTAPNVSLAGPATIKAGNPAVYTATSSATTFSWTVDGTSVNNTGNVLTTSFTTAGIHTVIVGASNSVGTTYDTVETDVFLCPAETLPFVADFSNGFGCWDTVSPTGTRWYLSEEMMQNPIGQILSISAQSSFFGMYDLEQDNWIISNDITMDNGGYEIAWRPFALGAPSYAADHYSVYVITGTDTNMVFSETLTAGDTTFAERVAVLPAGITGTFKIAFRHHDCTGGYAIAIDSIMVRALSAPTVSVTGPTSVMAGATATFTAISGNATSYAWSIDGIAQNETSNTLTTTFTTDGNHNVSVTASNSIGTSAPATIGVYVYTCNTITSFPWNEDFEAGLGCWTAIDADADGFNWEVESGYANEEMTYGYESNSAAVSASYDDPSGEALTPDNWLISPAIQIPSDANLTLSWYTLSYANATYALENYSVYVMSSTNIGDTIAQIFTTLTTNEWENQSVSLANYAGQTIRIGFRHYNCTDMYMFGVDDVTIATATGIDDVENSANVAIYPNPVRNMLTIKGDNVKSVEVIDMNGRVVLTNDRAGQLNMSDLSEGVYMVRVMSLSGVTTQKVIKK